MTADTIFFHEYAHYLLLSDFDRPLPGWFVEGFAEFMSTARIKKDGSVDLGLPADHRAIALTSPLAVQLPMTDLLSGRAPTTDAERSSLYARGWLLTHYLYFTRQRDGQLTRYLNGFASGTSASNSARAAFGDLASLDKEVSSYLRKGRFPYLTIPATQLQIAPVTVDDLSPGANAAMPLFIKLQTRAGPQADDVGAARRLADVYPNDVHVQMVRAEAEWVANDFVAAEQAADRAIALAPGASEAHIWKGRALLSRATRERVASLLTQARSEFTRANALDPENPEPLRYFYRSFVQQRKRPTANAVEGLHYAARLAPQDLALALTSATQYLRDKKKERARPLLLLVSQHPHGGQLGQRALAVLNTLGPAPDPAKFN